MTGLDVSTSPLRRFVNESNLIEGIQRKATEREVQAHVEFLAVERPGVPHLRAFVDQVASAGLRNRSGMNVRVGSHMPPPGGPNVEYELGNLLTDIIDDCGVTPWEAHVRYEKLHPFMDGNGRSGRALWAWHMAYDGLDPFALPFLHRFYYQTLDASRP